MTDPAATTDELRGRLTAGCDLSGNHRHRPAAGGVGRPPRLTRVHAAALLARAGAEVVAVHADGRIEVTTAAAFAATGRGHLGLARSELLDAGAHWCARTARWAPARGRAWTPCSPPPTPNSPPPGTTDSPRRARARRTDRGGEDLMPDPLQRRVAAAAAEFALFTATGPGADTAPAEIPEELVVALAAARRQAAAAKAKLTRARTGGDPAAIAAAEAGLRERTAAYTAVLAAAVDHQHTTTAATEATAAQPFPAPRTATADRPEETSCPTRPEEL